MASYVIHIVVAEEYLRKNKVPKENHDEFIEGVIYPDSVTDKSQTHYGKNSSETNLLEFLQANEITTSFNRGYFLHLLTDYLFYNKYLEYASQRELYNDYDILNEILIPKYHLKLPEKIEKYAFIKPEYGSQLKILSVDMIEDLVNKISQKNLDVIAKEVKENPDKWTKIRPLKKYKK